jgi:hypothetical protein
MCTFINYAPRVNIRCSKWVTWELDFSVKMFWCRHGRWNTALGWWTVSGLKQSRLQTDIRAYNLRAPLCLITCHSGKTCGTVNMYFRAFLASAADGCVWSVGHEPWWIQVAEWFWKAASWRKFCALCRLRNGIKPSLCYVTTSQLQVATDRKEWDVKNWWEKGTV